MRTPQEFVNAASDLAMEAGMLSDLDHKNIIRLRGVSSTCLSESFVEDRGYFLLMDVLEETLKDRLQRWRKEKASYDKRGLTSLFIKKNKKRKANADRMFGRIETVVVGVANGMKYLHDRNILLRDLKPANIGFDEAGKVRLFDFGMARKLEDCQANEVCGTPRYMAPEALTDKEWSLKTDVYSFGVVLYEICSLQVPFPPAGRRQKSSTLEDL
jgi:serine/threonine protein kinase